MERLFSSVENQSFLTLTNREGDGTAPDRHHPPALESPTYLGSAATLLDSHPSGYTCKDTDERLQNSCYLEVDVAEREQDAHDTHEDNAPSRLLLEDVH